MATFQKKQTSLLQGKVVLVTGAAGFIGSRVATCFRGEGASVLGLGHRVTQAQDAPLSYMQCVSGTVTRDSLASLSHIPDYIIHCAGGSSVAQSLADPHRDFERTMGATAAILDYARTVAPAACVVLVSSAAVYGDVNVSTCCENTPRLPVSPYGMHKMMAEDMAAMYAKMYGLTCTTVRLFSVYGPGLRKQLLWDACRKFSTGNPVQFGGTGDEERDWLHVADACDLLLLAAQNAPCGYTVINGGAGVAHKVRDVVALLGTELNATQQPTFDGVTRPGDPRRLVADIRLATAMGFSPRRDLAMGLREYVQWFKETTRA